MSEQNKDDPFATAIFLGFVFGAIVLIAILAARFDNDSSDSDGGHFVGGKSRMMEGRGFGEGHGMAHGR